MARSVPARHAVAGLEEYLSGLSWRRDRLKAELDTIESQKQELLRREAGLVAQLRSIETLLVAESAISESQGSMRGQSPPLASEAVSDAETTSGDVPSEIGNRIYTAVESSLRDAAVPLHYKSLAEMVQKLVPLRGKDPAATLLAYLSKVPQRFPRVGRGVYALAGATLLDGMTKSKENVPRAFHRRRRRRKR